MSDISVEQKLLLLRSIREAEDKNRMNLRQHENLLYGAGRQNEMTEPVYGTQDVPARQIREFSLGLIDFCSNEISGICDDIEKTGRLSDEQRARIIDCSKKYLDIFINN